MRHVCIASGVGAEIGLASLPASPALRSAFDGEMRRILQATGGDDYELCFTAPQAMRGDVEHAARESGTTVARIGHVLAGSGAVAFDACGTAWTPPRAGYAHFA